MKINKLHKVQLRGKEKLEREFHYTQSSHTNTFYLFGMFAAFGAKVSSGRSHAAPVSRRLFCKHVFGLTRVSLLQSAGNLQLDPLPRPIKKKNYAISRNQDEKRRFFFFKKLIKIVSSSIPHIDITQEVDFVRNRLARCR